MGVGVVVVGGGVVKHVTNRIPYVCSNRHMRHSVVQYFVSKPCRLVIFSLQHVDAIFVQ